MFTLTINLTSIQLQNFHLGGDKILLAKAVPTAQGLSQSQVTWLAMAPQATLVVSWQETYGIYVATALPIMEEAIIPANSLSSASLGGSYTYGSAGTFSGPSATPAPTDSYSLLNQYQNGSLGAPLTVGLLQAASVSNSPVAAAPVTADTVLQNQTDIMTPNPAVYIWAQSPGGSLASGMELIVVGSPLLVPFNSSTTSLTVTYNDATGAFQLTY
ncbi:hypothetical protein GO988_17325 [Hymenobacter sp. HMF4947]|uniref:Uncharacterized protein n=1 Tax=Hymenobacter ginkgonis TaxID=2682976 RepID=A0A7K1TI64_9BACT|nr:hypothetical protein [Hymenobacter ginkgonis]MVN78094.1 hypothetical protein [Hymenobacter ginkgonis]